MAGSFLESWMGASFSSIVGDPTVAGILFMGVFMLGTFIIVKNLPGRVAIIVPVSLLAMIFIPWLGVLVGLAVGVLLYIAIMALTGR